MTGQLLAPRHEQRPTGQARRGRVVAALLAFGLVVGPQALVSATEHDELPDPLPPDTTELEARGIERVCPPPADRGLDLAEPVAFPDIGSTHADAIACANAYRLISGFEDGTVRPGQAVTRGQTASVVRGWLELATGFALEVPAEQPFDDVAGTHADAIAALADIGVITGREDGTFRPDAPLNRGQFSRVVANAISYADVFRIDGPLPADPEPGSVSFTDVAGTTFENEILALAAARITTGTGEGAFSPSTAVTRGQLATFLMRSADYLDRHQRWRPTVRSVVLVADLMPREFVDDTDSTLDDGATSDPAGLELTPRGSVALVVNAFNGTLVYVADLSDVPALEDPAAQLRLRLGPVDADGPVVLELAAAAALETDGTGVVSGTVIEVDSALRYADLIAAPDVVFVELRAADLPGGALRGTLRTTS